MTQLNLFTELSNEAQNPSLRVCSVGGNVSYRQRFGLDNPPKGTLLKLKYMEGLKWYLHWESCQDGEDIVQGWFSTASKARKYANENGWLVSS
ncbi:MAG: hypothetical protein SFU27_00215 [Thermonemataceae bacterium]|nr:hypothetical protein [Thermonemataceae bacterium]